MRGLKCGWFAVVVINLITASGCENNTLEKENIALRGHCDSLEQELYYVTEMLDRAMLYQKYYIIGSESRLYADGLIMRVSGLSQEMKINPETKYSMLRRMRRCSSDTIRVVGKRVRVIGDFPPSSYHIVGDEEGDLHHLIITNKNRFWLNNNLLVITYR